MNNTHRVYEMTLAEEDLPSFIARLKGDEKYLYCTICWKSELDQDEYNEEDEERKDVVIQLTNELTFDDEVFYICRYGIDEIKELVSPIKSRKDFFIESIKKFTKNLE